MGPDEALGVCRRVVALAGTADVTARLTMVDEGATRFANSAITQNGARRAAALAVEVAFGQRRGEARIDRFDDEALREVVARATAIARLSPEDPEHLPPVAAGRYRELPGAAPASAAAGPMERALPIGAALRGLGADQHAAGAFTTEASVAAFANGAGAEGAFTSSAAQLHATVVGPTSSGWARSLDRDVARLDAAAVVERARRGAEAAAEPVPVEPGEHRVVLAPAAVAELLAFLVHGAHARDADEGRSAFAGRLGRAVVSPRVTLRSVLDDPAVPGVPWDRDGAPTADTTWIEDGVLRAMITTRYWAAHTGRVHTPYPGVVSMDGAERSVDELVAQVDRGLYVTRFWYTRQVDPMSLLLTGMTRDALLRIEGGRIVGGARHLRYNDSPLRVLSRVLDVGRPEVTQVMGVRGRVPPLLVEGLRFTSGTSF